MNKKIKLLIILSCCCICTIIGGAVGLVSCGETKDFDSSNDKNWTSNY